MTDKDRELVSDYVIRGNFKIDDGPKVFALLIECSKRYLTLDEAIGKAADMESELKAERERVKKLKRFADDISSNYDCDGDGHRYSTYCRKCDAKKVLEETK
jgi:hypothetical protein